MMDLKGCCEEGRDVKKLEEFDTPPQVVLEVWITGLVGSLAPLGRGGLAGRRGLLRTFLDSGQLPTTVHSTTNTYSVMLLRTKYGIHTTFPPFSLSLK